MALHFSIFISSNYCDCQNRFSCLCPDHTYHLHTVLKNLDFQNIPRQKTNVRFTAHQFFHAALCRESASCLRRVGAWSISLSPRLHGDKVTIYTKVSIDPRRGKVFLLHAVCVTERLEQHGLEAAGAAGMSREDKRAASSNKCTQWCDLFRVALIAARYLAVAHSEESAPRRYLIVKASLRVLSCVRRNSLSSLTGRCRTYLRIKRSAQLLGVLIC